MTHLLSRPAPPGLDLSDPPVPANLLASVDLDTLSDAELAKLLGDPVHGKRACEALVTRYHGLVRHSARQYQLPAQHYEDLVQVGYVGLMKAINNFDPDVREELKPYAHSCVSGEIKRYFRDKRWLIRVSRTDQ